MNVAAISALLDLVQIVSAVTQQINAIGAVVKKAQDEGRDITAEEWAEIDGAQIAERAKAVAAVAGL